MTQRTCVRTLPIFFFQCNNKTGLTVSNRALLFLGDGNQAMWQCHYCRTTLSLEVQNKNRLCPSCGSDLHCCRNCTFFDENLTSKCKEPESPWIRDRGVQNSCTFFEFSLATPETKSTQVPEITSESEKAKEAFRALFRNS